MEPVGYAPPGRGSGSTGRRTPTRSRRRSSPHPKDGELAAYTRVLTDVLTGGSSLSVSGQESEQAWRIVEPVLDAWANGAAPLLEYPAGSAGPSHLAGAADR